MIPLSVLCIVLGIIVLFVWSVFVGAVLIGAGVVLYAVDRR